MQFGGVIIMWPCDVVCSKLNDGENMRTGVPSGGLGAGVLKDVRNWEIDGNREWELVYVGGDNDDEEEGEEYGPPPNVSEGRECEWQIDDDVQRRAEALHRMLVMVWQHYTMLDVAKTLSRCPWLKTELWGFRYSLKSCIGFIHLRWAAPLAWSLNHWSCRA